MKSIMVKFIYFREQIKILHWQTSTYARHMAYDKFYNDMDDLVDSFIETYQGKYGRIMFDGSDNIEFKDSTSIKLKEFLESMTTFLTVELASSLKNEDSDLLNIRDEMLGKLNTLKYLLTLK